MILLVEDDAITRMAMAEALRSSGLQVLEAGNGKEALELLDPNPVQLVVTDLVLPDIDGLKFMDQIHWRRPRLPILLISGYMSQYAGDAIVSGSRKVDKFLAKPIRQSAFIRTVQELLGSV